MVEQISIEEFGIMKEQISAIHKTILGNGQPGLIQNFDNAKSRIDKIEGGISAIKWMVGVFGIFSITALIATIKLYL